VRVRKASGRTPRRRREHRLSTPAVGLLALAVIALVTFLGFKKELPFQEHFEVRAVFTSANGVKANSPVRIAGVNVGKVTGVEGRGEHAVVTMRIDEKGRPLHRDATFAIRPRIFLEGNFFVDVAPGTNRAPEVDDGDTIPIQQTKTPVQLDQILTALQSDTRDDLQVLLKQYGKALDGEGGDGFNRSMPYWEPAYRSSAQVTDAMLGELEHDLSSYVRDAGLVSGALDRHREQLKALITDFHTTAGAFARADQPLRSAIAELPRTLRAAHPALGKLNDAFPSVRALAADLRPGVQSARPAIAASLPLVGELRGLVGPDELRGLAADLRPTVPALAKLTDDSIPLSKEGRRLAGCQNSVILPWSRDTVPDKQFPARGPVYQEAPKPFVGLAGESRSGDANGSWFRVLASGGSNLYQLRPGVFFTNALPILGVNPPKPQSRPPLRTDVPCETQETPDLRTKPGIPPKPMQVDTSSPAFLERYQASKDRAVKWLRGQLEYEGLSDVLTVVDEDATPSLIDRIAGGKKP
jgi:virulence factor Mce-like protein